MQAENYGSQTGTDSVQYKNIPINQSFSLVSSAIPLYHKDWSKKTWDAVLIILAYLLSKYTKRF